MQSDESARPAEWDIALLQRSIGEWEEIAGHILLLLSDDTTGKAPQNWQPHASQITRAVERFRALCRREAEQLGDWRADGVAADEAYEAVWDEAEKLVQWLKRMMQQETEG